MAKKDQEGDWRSVRVRTVKEDTEPRSMRGVRRRAQGEHQTINIQFRGNGGRKTERVPEVDGGREE